MDIEQLREYCLAVKGAHECFPFDENVLVFKVMEKMFAYTDIAPRDGSFRVNLKCDPERSVELREEYRGIVQGVHTKSMMWNSVYLESDVPDTCIRELIDHSVEEVIRNLPKKKRELYRNMPDTPAGK